MEKRYENQEKKTTLWEEILRFKKYKIPLVILLLGLGALGLILPVIPGLLFLMLALALFRPGMMQKIRTQLRNWKVI